MSCFTERERERESERARERESERARERESARARERDSERERASERERERESERASKVVEREGDLQPALQLLVRACDPRLARVRRVQRLPQRASLPPAAKHKISLPSRAVPRARLRLAVPRRARGSLPRRARQRSRGPRAQPPFLFCKAARRVPRDRGVGLRGSLSGQYGGRDETCPVSSPRCRGAPGCAARELIIARLGSRACSRRSASDGAVRAGAL